MPFMEYGRAFSKTYESASLPVDPESRGGSALTHHSVLIRWVLAFVFLCLVLPIRGQLANTPWPRYHLDNQNTGRGIGFGAINVLKWQVSLGSNLYAPVTIAADGTLYTGDSHGNFLALDPLTGTQKWSFAAGSQIISGGALDVSGSMYFADETGNLYSVNSATGILNWKSQVSNGIYGCPCIGQDGTIYVGSLDQSVYAFSGSTGLQLWKYTTGGNIWDSLALGNDGTVYAASTDNNLYAIDGSGKLKWSFLTGGHVSSPPTVGANGIVYFGSDDKYVYALDSGTGSVKWKFATGGAVESGAAIGPDGTVYIGSQDNNLYALDGASGALKWQYATGGYIQASPVIDGGGAVYVVSFSGTMSILDAQTGLLRWSFSGGSKFEVTPTIGSDGSLYVPNDDGNLYAFISSSEFVPPASITLSPTSVLGGNTSQATVTISSPAPSGGSYLQITSSNSAAQTPGVVAIAPGQTSGTFTVTTQGVDSTVKATITVSGGGVSKSATLTINPASCSAVTLNPTTVFAGGSSTGTVSLNGSAGPSGTVVTLSSDNPAAQVPQSVTVPAGKSTATFSVTTSYVASQTVATLTGASNGITASAQLTINPTSLYSVTLNPTTVAGGFSSTGTVTLNGIAPPNGAVITLASDNSVASAPTSVTVAEGKSTATFTVATNMVSSNTFAMISASWQGTTKSAQLNIDPVALASITLNPTTVVGGYSSTGTATLTGPAPTGVVVVLASSNTSLATVPGYVTIPAGQTSATFQITTSSVSSQAHSTISGSYQGVSKTALLTVVTGPSVDSLVISPSSVMSGDTATGTVTLSSYPPFETVTLSSDNPAAVVPSSVHTYEHYHPVTFSIKTLNVTTPTVATITATLNGTSKTAQLTINPLPLASISFSPSVLTGGNTSTGLVTLSEPAGSSGIVVTLSSNASSVTVPQSVTVAAGQTQATFSAQTLAVSTQSVATITAALGGLSSTATVTVNPATITGLSISPNIVVGGKGAIGTVTLSGPALSSGDVVTLSSNTATVGVPSSVTVPAGQTTATFAISTQPVGTTTLANISATFGGVSASAQLTVVPDSVQSLTLSPGTVMGGSPSTATVVLSHPAGTSGVLVNLSSNNPAATMPGSVTVAAGQTTATFTVTTIPVGSQTAVTITASFAGTSQSATLTINPASVASIALNPTSVLGGGHSTGTVTLNGLAPSSGAMVSLSSNNSAATVASSVLVPAGQSSATFTVTTSSVSNQTSAVITGSLAGVAQTASLTITSATLQSLTLSPSSVLGGRSSTAMVTLTSAAGPSGDVVNLSCSSSSVTLPATVTVPSGQTTATFQVSTLGVSSQTVATITASFAGTSQSASLTINPAGLASISLNPTSVLGGVQSTGTVTLSGLAPSSGAIVSLSSNNLSATVASSVLVPSGQSSATFIVTTSGVSNQTTAVITGSWAGVAQTAALTITPATVQSLTLNPSSVQGGSSSTATVTMSGAAGPSGNVVKLSCSSSSATLPATVTIAAGQTTATFIVTTTPVSSQTAATVTAAFAGTSQSAALTISQATLQSLTFNPNSVQGGRSSTGTVILSGLAGPGGNVVSLSCSSNSLTLPATVTVPGGQTAATFQVSTFGVNTPVMAKVTATSAGSAQSANLTVNPAVLTSVSIAPSSLIGGVSSKGTVTLSGLAGPGGVTVSLSGTSTAVTVPSTVTVAFGQSSAVFNISTQPVAMQTVATIFASFQNAQQYAQLTVNPPTPVSLTLNPSTIAEGTSSTATVTLSGPAPNGTFIAVSSNNLNASVPDSVFVPFGQTSATFSIYANPGVKGSVATITAQLSGVSQSAVLTMNILTLVSVSLDPSTVLGGISSTGTVTLNDNAPSVGAYVLLQSSNSQAQVQKVILIPPGSSSAKFVVQTTAVKVKTIATITASAGAVSVNSPLTILPPPLLTLAVLPSTIKGGATSTGTVTLGSPAPIGGLTVNLKSGNSKASVPATVVVPAGQTSASFTVKTKSVESQTIVTLSATSNGISVTAALTIL